jgi:divalent metal cation (Fe/Co/Zn/Cd) transporter
MPRDLKIEDAHKLCDHLEHDIKNRLGESKISIHIEPCEGVCDDCKKVCENKRTKRRP